MTVPPIAGEVKLVAVVLLPLQTTWFVVATVAVGFTVMVNVLGVPGQALLFVKIGVTVIVATMG